MTCPICKSSDSYKLDLPEPFNIPLSILACSAPKCRSIVAALRLAFLFKDYPDDYFRLVYLMSPDDFDNTLADLDKLFAEYIQKPRKLLSDRLGLKWTATLTHINNINSIQSYVNSGLPLGVE